MSDITYFDCNTSLGRPSHGTYRPCPDAHSLLTEMDWVGVGLALVRHALMWEQSPVVGNAAILEATDGEARLLPTWAILPPQTRELGSDFFGSMRQAGVRALWAFPARHRYLLRRRTFGSFLDEVADRRIPLFVPRDAGGPQPSDTWHLVYDLLDEYPTLTLVMAHQGPWGEDRFFRPLLEQCERFYLDLSRYELDCGLSALVRDYGYRRLLYGSHFPETSMGGPRLQLARAEIGDEARAAIAGGNLRSLLSEVSL